MDLNRVNDAEKLDLCKKYFIGGFFALPLLWLVNICWFSKQAFFRDNFPEQAKIKYYVTGSLIGFVVYTIPIVSWAIYFQKYRTSLGDFGESISFIVPAGIP